jgi:hypothetical protein
MADVIYYVKDGMLYKDRENDGITYLKYGAEREVTCLCSVEEAKIKYPDKLARASRESISNAIH